MWNIWKVLPQGESRRAHPILWVEDDGDRLLHSDVMGSLRRDLGFHFNYDDLAPVQLSPDFRQTDKRQNARD